MAFEDSREKVVKKANESMAEKRLDRAGDKLEQRMQERVIAPEGDLKSKERVERAGEKNTRAYANAADKREKANDKTEKLASQVDDAVASGNQAKAERKNDKLFDAGQASMDLANATTGGPPQQVESIGSQVEADAEAPAPAGGGLAPGLYTAAGDDYQYEVQPDGNIKVILPDGRGEKIVTPNDGKPFFAAIKDQIDSGQLEKFDEGNLRERALGRMEGVEAGPEVDAMVEEPAAPAAPPAAPAVAAGGEERDPVKRLQSLKSSAMQKAYGG